MSKVNKVCNRKEIGVKFWAVWEYGRDCNQRFEILRGIYTTKEKAVACVADLEDVFRRNLGPCYETRWKNKTKTRFQLWREGEDENYDTEICAKQLKVDELL